MSPPLPHLRVLDLSRVLAGPWAGQILADLGAEVIKVEHPEGDDTRAWGPPFLKDREGRDTAESAYFLGANRGKRSLAVDIARPEGAALVRRLALASDVVIENFKVGGLAKYGLDYPSLQDEAPGLVYCSITGFGQTGPYAGRAGYDFMIQGMGGLMSVTGEPDGSPMKVGVALADVMTGLYATIAVQAALAHRERTGRGQHIDMALLDVQVATLANQAMNYLVGGQAPGRLGNAHPNIVPYEAFATADGHIILAVGNDRQFAAFAGLAGHPEWTTDPLSANSAARVNNRAQVVGRIAEAMTARPSAWWLAELEKLGVPAGPINTLDRVFADPQVIHRQMRMDLPHPLAGTVPQVASPLRFSATPPHYPAAPPLLGQHTEEVLRERLGLDPAEIRRLAAAGVVRTGR